MTGYCTDCLKDLDHAPCVPEKSVMPDVGAPTRVLTDGPGSFQDACGCKTSGM